ncbi:MAG: hypothetical protein ACXVRZ_06685 [Gaiellaceae bacterium]
MARTLGELAGGAERSRLRRSRISRFNELYWVEDGADAYEISKARAALESPTLATECTWTPPPSPRRYRATWNLSGPFSTMTHTGMRFVSEGDVVFEGDVWLGAFADAFEEIKD